MKISASIYSDKLRPLDEVIHDLVVHEVDLLHVDCRDNPAVFNTIRQIREWCDIPVDLHIITDRPALYYDLLRQHPVDYVTFQYEDLRAPLRLPPDLSAKRGLAITTPTDISVFDEYKDFDFILIMATVPGQSGGVFDPHNFSKIRQFRNKYPGKAIHVDGGVNAEVSFILRNMGVTVSVSGSYLFNASSIGNALMNLTRREAGSGFLLCDFMIPLAETPTVLLAGMSLREVLLSIDRGRLGFTLVVDADGRLVGIISNADVRKGLLRHLDDLRQLAPQSLINTCPVVAQASSTVMDMLQLIKSAEIPIMYLPVVDGEGKAAGVVTFLNLVKGEL